jgi:xylan 1,4-beta-xylosidase
MNSKITPRIGMFRLFILIGAGVIFSDCSAQKKDLFEYQNPIRNGITNGMRDCQVFQDGGKYYLTGTSYPFWYRNNQKNPGVKIYSSDDLLNWKFEKLLIDRSKLDTTVWYLDRFWAPEIHKIQGKYYLSFNCVNQSTVNHRVESLHSGVAMADDLLGDYKVITHDEPLLKGNDLTLYEDDDGKVYAFNNHSKTIFVSEMDMGNVKAKGEPKACITAGTLENGDWDGISIEGAYCIKNEGQYYLFYSSWSRGYEIGYATADNPLGPWIKYEGNPVYGAQLKQTCEKNNLEFTGDPDSPWGAVGHNEVFTGPDGRLWISCHGISKEDRVPFLVIDPIDFVDGVIKINGPTYTKQSITY